MPIVTLSVASPGLIDKPPYPVPCIVALLSLDFKVMASLSISINQAPPSVPSEVMPDTARVLDLGSAVEAAPMLDRY